MRATWSSPRATATCRASRPLRRTRRRSWTSCTPRPTAGRRGWQTVACWWSAPAPRGSRSPPSSGAPGATSYLSAGRHARMPRTYRGRDVFAWLHATGQLDDHVDHVPDLAAARRAPSFPVSGANGGESLGLDRLAALGVVVAGRLDGFAGDHALFGDTLKRDVADADRRLLALARALRRLHLARARRGAGGGPAPGGRARRRPAPPGPPRAGLHGPLGHRLPPQLSVAPRARPRRERRARAPAGRHGRPRSLRAGIAVPAHPQVALPRRRGRRRGADRPRDRRQGAGARMARVA